MPRLNGQLAGFNGVKIIFLYLKFPEEILNEQSAMPRRDILVAKGLGPGRRWCFCCFIQILPKQGRRYQTSKISSAVVLSPLHAHIMLALLNSLSVQSFSLYTVPSLATHSKYSDSSWSCSYETGKTIISTLSPNSSGTKIDFILSRFTIFLYYGTFFRL